MVGISVEVREREGLLEVAVYADSISQAIAKARGRFPGHAVRVLFSIDGEGFFGGRGTEGVSWRTAASPGFCRTGCRRQA